MRFSRPCYDKPHRCPGWAGGGMTSARTDRCDNGRIKVRPRGARERHLAAQPAHLIDYTKDYFDDHPGSNPLRFGHCTVCDVVTWPWFTRRLDPTAWVSDLRSHLRRAKWALEDRRRGR
jgi:hypothetical protein